MQPRSKLTRDQLPRFKVTSNTRPLGRLFAALGAESRGVAVVETALVMPFLAAVIMGVVDTARFASSQLIIQQAVNRGLEMSVMAGPSLAASNIQSQAAAQANLPTSAVSVTQTLECSGVATSWSASCTTGQETARYTRIEVGTTFTPTFVGGVLAKLWGNANGDVSISAAGAIRIQ